MNVPQAGAHSTCPDCGAVWADGVTCTDHFYQMLYWEMEDPTRWEVHHFMVLCYHLQHPHLYSPEMLADGIVMLDQFVNGGVTPQEMRREISANVDSGVRKHKITGTADHHGVYAHPVAWTMTAADVVAAGADRYVEQVRVWAKSMDEALKKSGNS